MSNTDQKKSLYEFLKSQYLLEYGSRIEASLVREFLGIKLPEIGTKAVFDQLTLEELAAIDYIRNILLGEGKYLKSHGDAYTILLPSENKLQVELYMRSADKKLNRALKLSKSSPKESDLKMDQLQARILLKKSSRR